MQRFLFQGLTLAVLILAGSCNYEKTDPEYPTFEVQRDSTDFWNRRYVDAIQIHDGKYVALGMLDNGNDMYKIILDKYSRDGRLLWSRPLGVGENFPVNVRELSNGDLAIAGSQREYGYVIRTDPDGKVRPQDVNYTIPTNLYPKSTIEAMDLAPDGSLVLYGVAEISASQHKMLYIRLIDNGQGFTQSRLTPLDPPAKKIIFGSSGIRVSPAGDAAVIATTSYNSFVEPPVGTLLKLGLDGEEAWRDTLRGGSLYDVAISADGGAYYAVGTADNRMLAMKIGSSRSGRWVKLLSGDVAYGVAALQEGGMAVTGAQSNGAGQSVSLQWLSPEGAPGRTSTSFVGLSDVKPDAGQSIVQTAEGGLLIAGYSTRETADFFTGYLIKTDESGTVHP